jgi:hypothetical protein
VGRGAVQLHEAALMARPRRGVFNSGVRFCCRAGVRGCAVLPSGEPRGGGRGRHGVGAALPGQRLHAGWSGCLRPSVHRIVVVRLAHHRMRLCLAGPRSMRRVRRPSQLNKRRLPLSPRLGMGRARAAAGAVVAARVARGPARVAAAVAVAARAGLRPHAAPLRQPQGRAPAVLRPHAPRQPRPERWMPRTLETTNKHKQTHTTNTTTNTNKTP